MNSIMHTFPPKVQEHSSKFLYLFFFAVNWKHWVWQQKKNGRQESNFTRYLHLDLVQDLEEISSFVTEHWLFKARKSSGTDRLNIVSIEQVSVFTLSSFASNECIKSVTHWRHQTPVSFFCDTFPSLQCDFFQLSISPSAGELKFGHWHGRLRTDHF